jgi:hypothetical protein
MADTQPKKTRKCGTCGQEGHDKRKCQKVEVKPETKDEPQTVYGVLVKEDNGDAVSEWFTLYASLDGLVKGIEKVIRTLEDGCDNEDEKEPENQAKESRRYQTLHYYTDEEVFKNISPPSRDYVVNLMTKPSYVDNHLIIKVGDTLGGAACFACEISLFKKTLNP